jgi:hypothetical protein
MISNTPSSFEDIAAAAAKDRPAMRWSMAEHPLQVAPEFFGGAEQSTMAGPAPRQSRVATRDRSTVDDLL